MAQLNPEQRAAAEHGEGPAIVLAGPGTGKTTALAARHAVLVGRGVSADQIFACTFTGRSGEELRRRLGLEGGPRRPFVGTFHSLASRLLRRFHASAGLPRDFQIYDEAKQRQVLSELGIVWDADDGDLSDIIGRWKDRMVTPEEAAGANEATLRTASAHYAAYEEEMLKRGACDFADLILRCVRGMEADPQFRAWVTERFHHVLVDEFQDVNKLQMQFLRLVCGSRRNVWAVGDDDQSLYGWRGADVRYAVDFSSHFRGAKTYVLSRNYRCPPVVVTAASGLIANNKVRVRKTLQAVRSERRGDALLVAGFPTDKEEAAWIAKRAGGIIAAGGDPQSIAVLVRAASVTPTLQRAFEKERVPFSLHGAVDFWSLPETREVLAVLRLIAHPRNQEAEAALGGGRRGRILMELARTMRGSTIKECAIPAGRAVGAEPPLGMDGERRSLWADAAEQAALEAMAFPDFEAFFKHVADRPPASDNADGVTISTIHAAKGLEWDWVFVAGCDAQMMPHRKSQDIEEERRLLFVALTRARRAVAVTYALSRFARGQQPSPFLPELAAAMRSTGAPQGFRWTGSGAPNEQSAVNGRAAGLRAQAAPQSNGSRAPAAAPSLGARRTYRRGGGRSLIPPEERDA